ncbi:hypothetical protein LXL04_036608 [Taraxacum kok-saghyz]
MCRDVEGMMFCLHSISKIKNVLALFWSKSWCIRVRRTRAHKFSKPKPNWFSFAQSPCAQERASLYRTASESAFSVGAKVIDKYRTAMKSDITEALICTKDWMFGEDNYNPDDSVNEIVSLDVNEEASTTRIEIRVVFVFAKFVSCKFVSDTNTRHDDTNCQVYFIPTKSKPTPMTSICLLLVSKFRDVT